MNKKFSRFFDQSMVIDFALLTFLVFCLHGKLVNGLNESFFIPTTGEHFWQYGIMANPEFQFIGDTAPSSPFYIIYFIAGLSILLFGHTALGVTAYGKLFIFFTLLWIYFFTRKITGSRTIGWLASTFFLLFPEVQNFADCRGDFIAIFFGWLGVGMLFLSIKQEILKSQNTNHDFSSENNSISSKENRWFKWTPFLAGVFAACAFLSHPYGLQFYMGACLVLLVNFFGLFGWLKNKITWLYLLGYGSFFSIFAIFVINWKKYLYIISFFSSMLQFIPGSSGFGADHFIARFKNTAGPFFYFENYEPGYLATSLFSLAVIVFIGAIWETVTRQPLRIYRAFFLIYLAFAVIHVFLVAAYRPYAAHTLPLYAILIALTLSPIGNWIKRISGNKIAKKLNYTGAVIISVILGTLAVRNIISEKTLFHAPSKYTYIQDTIADLKSVIPPGSRVITDVLNLFLFPDNIVRTTYVLQQLQQLPHPKYIIEEQKQDNIIDAHYQYGEDVRKRWDLQSRYHFQRFVPNYFVTGYYANLNTSKLVATLNNNQGVVLRVYKVNYNGWPFKNIPPKTRLYPSLSDPISAIRYREFLHQGLANEEIVPEPVLLAKASVDNIVTFTPDQKDAIVNLDGSQSWSKNQEIVKYEWEMDHPLDGRRTHYNNENYMGSFVTVAQGEKASIRLPYGKHYIHLLITDKSGNQSRDAKVIRVDIESGGMINYALKSNGGIATGMLEHIRLSPENAINGERKSRGEGIGILTSWTSENDLNAWWQVDLGGKSREIKLINIFFRSDFYAADQTNHIEIWGSNDPQFTSHEILASRGEETYPRSGYWAAKIDTNKKYRYIRISKKKPSYTSFVEVEVYGNQEFSDIKSSKKSSD